jgi:phospholipid/cholesterol/gamma-HCH transport system ATP-binding protein
MDAMIEYRGVWKSFDLPVLRGVDLAVARGETLAVVGPSGTGKSVLLKTTIGLVAPDHGDVRVGGESVFRGGRGALARIRRKVAYVFQNAALFDSMTVFDNVAQGLPDDELRRVPRLELSRRVADALEHVNLDPRAVAGKLPSELSGGMRKRVGLARAIIGKPEIVLYDEPVTGLDPVTADAVHRLIHRLDRELGATSVIVTHDVEGALGIADRVAMLEGGRIRFFGTPAEFRDSEDPLVHSYIHRADAMIAEDAEALEAV